MKLAPALSLACLLLLLQPGDGLAQSRPRRNTTPKRPATTARGKKPATRSNAATLALQDGRVRVGEKIKQISSFVYLYGRFSKDFENAVGPGGGRPDATANTLKTRLVSSLQGIREGLDGLELHFRTTPELERFYLRLAGVAAGAANAEEQATANRLDAAGRSLLEVINRLTDVLQEMN